MTGLPRALHHVAASDCERCRPGLVAQPVNAASSLAFVVAGALALRSSRRRGVGAPAEVAVGWSAIAAGLGSVAYHGPGTVLGRYLHDASLLSLLATTALADHALVSGRSPSRAALAAVPAVSLVAAHPTISTGAQAVLGVAATAAEATRFATVGASRASRWRQRLEVGVVGAGVLAHVFGRTGGPCCRPDSRAQPHAAWHVAMATGVYLRSLDLR